MLIFKVYVAPNGVIIMWMIFWKICARKLTKYSILGHGSPDRNLEPKASEYVKVLW